MRDSKLFEHIQSLIRQSHNSRPSQPSTFAERYCKQQMMKKKLNVTNRGQKMTYLMRNFRGLQTFVDLPQLIQAVKRWKFDQMKQEKQNNNEQQNLSNRQQQPTVTSLYKSLKSDPNLGQKIKKQLGDKMKQKYLNENSLADQLLSSLQKTTTINSAGLKNNSANNINLLYEKVQQQGEDRTWKGGMEFLAKLNESQSIMIDGKDELNKLGEWLEINKIQQDNNDRDREMNMKLRKEYTKLLHKITTYIQIVLEMQHRQKWQAKNSQNQYNHGKKLHKTFVLKRNQTDIEKNKQNSIQKNKMSYTQTCKFTPINMNLNKKTQKFRLRTTANNSSMFSSKFRARFQQNEDLQNKTLTNNSSLLLSQKSQKLSKNPQNTKITKLKKQPVFLHRQQFSQLPSQEPTNISHLDNSEIDIRCTTSSMRTNTLNSYRSKQNLYSSQKFRHDSFLRTTSSSNLRQQAIKKRRADFKSQTKQVFKPSLIKTNNSLKSQSTLRQTFTFRHRDVKQKIINRLGSFIRQIDQQQQNNKKQNNYYINAINKLQNTLSLCFGQFRQEDVAGQRDIETLKKYAKVFSSGNKGGLSSKFITFDDNPYGGDILDNDEMNM